MYAYWQRQTNDKALFDDLLWSRPVNKNTAGKLLIIGGHAQGFKAPASAYNYALKARVGSTRVLIPSSLKLSIGQYLEDAVYCPSNKSGSFSKESLAEFLDHAAWGDLTLLSGDFGHNSETSILIEAFLSGYKKAICLTGDALDPFLANPSLLFNRSQTLIVSNLSSLQKLLISYGSDKAITSSMNLIQLVEILNELTIAINAHIITFHQGSYVAASKGQVSTTKASSEDSDWPLILASYAAVWWLQNISSPFEAITTAAYDAFK